jgi:hypothetical protein
VNTTSWRSPTASSTVSATHSPLFGDGKRITKRERRTPGVSTQPPDAYLVQAPASAPHNRPIWCGVWPSGVQMSWAWLGVGRISRWPRFPAGRAAWRREDGAGEAAGGRAPSEMICSLLLTAVSQSTEFEAHLFERRRGQLVAFWAGSRSGAYPAGAGADGSVCHRPNSLPCGSRQVTNQPMPGTGPGWSASPPSSLTRAAPALMSSTSK